MNWTYELTDTFGGQANYSWVRRGEVSGSLVTALRRVRQRFGLAGRAVISRHGDALELRWPKINTVLFFAPADV